MDERDDYSDEAWRLARKIESLVPSRSWPALPPIVATLTQFLTETQRDALRTDVRQALNVAYFAGVCHAALSVEMEMNVQGWRLSFPPLADAFADRLFERLVSFESALQSEISADQAAALAARLQGVVDLIAKMQLDE